jgi:glucan phosphoethanolaminetransferase (alkaline phosphatase superfamily)
MKLYAAKAEAEASPPPPVSAERITPTEVVVVISETMRAVNLNLFDLSMWYRRAR